MIGDTRATASGLVQQILDAHDQLDALTPKDKEPLYSMLYTPHARLGVLLGQLADYLKKPKPTPRQQQRAGKIMERITCAAFSGLRGYNHVASYRSPGFQVDLLMNGTELHWRGLCSTLRIDKDRRGILVESKARASKVTDAQFSRLCALIHHNYPSSVSLGVLFSIKGATGFPKKQKTPTPQQKKRLLHLRESRMRQVMFRASTGIPVVVFDWADIQAINKVGALPRILEQKIMEIEALSSLPLTPGEHASCDLPPYLADLESALPEDD
jgi:hypothetical protein